MRCSVKGFHGNNVAGIFFLLYFFIHLRSNLVFTRTCDKVTFVVTQAGGLFTQPAA